MQLLVKVIFIFIIISAPLFSQNHKSDSLALVALYNSTNGANWTNKWDLKKSYKDWYGIIRIYDTITHIMLGNNGLDGVIPKEIGNFKYLLD